MQTLSLFDAKTHLSRIVEELVEGATDQVVISRRGKPVVRMTALRKPDATKRIGLAKGRFKTPDDIDRLNPAVAALFASSRSKS